MLGYGKKIELRLILAGRLAGFVLLGLCVLFTTCDIPMGLGRPIDWEPPVLDMDPGSNPRYVRLGTKLTGNVTDNIAVDRVILREAGSTAEMFRANLLPNNRWEIELIFSEEENGKKIAVEVVAFDRAGNSGEASIAAITLIIDIRPPVITDTWIQRTSIRTAVLEPYFDLKELETTDPNGERSINVNRYQNGWFNIYAKVSEAETRIENVELKIYDIKDSDTPLLMPQRGGTLYAPHWLIKEDDILQAGERRWLNYTANYDAGERYYYRVDIVAYDRAENGTDEIEIVEEQNYFCMWIKSDEPKGILDPVLGTVVPRGTPLPVQFYDDDSIEWAYTDLFTEDQWNDPSFIGRKGSGTIDEQKLNWLKDQLVDQNALIDNWKSDKGYTASKIVELIEGKSIDEKWAYVETGNSENDYGEYVLFSLVKDKKLSPHTGTGPRTTNEDMWKGRFWRISVIDDNLPTVVFDTVDTTPGSGYDASKHPGNDIIDAAKTGNSPEENTFPKLTSDPSNPSGGGRYFTINGYTLRENRNELNKVVKFRMAWIPYGMPGGADSHVNAVREALKRGSGYPEGVQYWHFVDADATPAPGEIQLIDGTPEEIGKAPYRKQVFRKTFDILGGPDDIKPEWNNFNYRGERENETKLFVFYAEDNIGEQHGVFRTVRLLGNKTPPGLTVYDISNLSEMEGVKPPILSDYDLIINDGNANGTIEPNERTAYESALKAYQVDAYSLMRELGMSASLAAPPYQTYTRGTTLKYWVMAERSGDLAVSSITMDDITYNPGKLDVGSEFNSTDRALSYCETLPEVTQRVFLFTATDTLGNKAQIQRTIAVTNQAFLVDISTTEQTGTYGIGKTITLRANFSGQVEYTAGPGNSGPQLNVRYPTSGDYGYASLDCTTAPDTSVLSLEFDFVVPEGANGRLDTMYNGLGGSSTNFTDRPIKLNGARILDAVRKDDAFTPGNSPGMGDWTTAERSLQDKKTITLDGIRPSIIDVFVSGKLAYQSSTDYYFKNGETINLTLFSFLSIRPFIVNGENPRLQYFIRDVNASIVGPYNTAFTYQRPSGNTGMVFSLPVNTTNLPSDGELINVSLYTGTGTGLIVDDVDNPVVASTVESLIPAGTRIYIKKTPPGIPNATLDSASFGTDSTNYYNQPPILRIADSTNFGPNNLAWEDLSQYSLNGGLSWVRYPDTYSGWTTISVGNLVILAGEWDLCVRYVDRAGNEGNERKQKIHVNDTFPKLVDVSAGQPNGYYKSEAPALTLRYSLEFEDIVTGSATITLSDRGDLIGATGSQTLTANANGSTTIVFDWPLNGNWEMPNGLIVSYVNFTGLSDRFGNHGAESSSPTANLNAGQIVDTIPPTPTTYTPVNAAGRPAGNMATSVSSSNKEIRITFNETVRKGSGTITIRPQGTYAVPAVFENDGYYSGDTWIAGFYDVYNDTPSGERAYLTQGSSMSNLTTDQRTGQSAGPYKKTTHGLIAGVGYTGNYLTTGANGPNPQDDFMVPDTATKWVLDYQYQINQNVAAVNNIRTALNSAKWRWQELDVSSTNVTGAGTSTIVITLPETLLPGLQWTLTYTTGTFTDQAGNNAPALNAGTYWFWSSGVQTPVVRVDRKSYDARAINTDLRNNSTYNAPTDVVWGINAFNTINYRIESETPGASISYGTINGSSWAQTPTAGYGSVTAAWDGAVRTGTLNNNIPAASYTASNWNNTALTNGAWILPNLIRRAGNNTALIQYTVVENGTTIERIQSNPTWTGNANDYQGFRSYNRDARLTELDNVALSAFTLANNQGSFTYDALEASKNYVVAQASINHGGGATNSGRGYEGVFRSVVAFNQNTTNNQGLNAPPYQITGSNIKNGIPSIAGFPIRDAEDIDMRFVKYFYRVQAAAGDLPSHNFWISSEIVSQWYVIGRGSNAGNYQSTGEVNNYLTAGYGDLTYSYNQR